MMPQIFRHEENLIGMFIHSYEKIPVLRNRDFSFQADLPPDSAEDCGAPERRNAGVSAAG
jgi:hypothetical protein